MGFDADGALYAALLAEQKAMCAQYGIPRLAIADVMRSLLTEALEARAKRRAPPPTKPARVLLGPLETLDDIIAHCVVDDTGCWLWTRSLTHGYAQANNKGKRTGHVHRIAYEIAHGHIPAGMVVDHVCRVRRCVNPKHLRLLTAGENSMAEGSQSIAKKNSLKTHCRHGHPMDGKGPRGRFCRTCRRIKQDNEKRKIAEGTTK